MTKRYHAPARHAVSLCVLVAAWLVACGEAAAQPPDLVLLDGKVVTVDAQSSLHEALAIRDGKISGVGSTAEIRRLAGPATRVVELDGRTVIPGLIDSHLHAMRAALSFSTEVNWIGARSLRRSNCGGSARRRERGRPAAWLIVAGGWNELQFAERRRPTQAELEAAAPDNPVYVQLGYGWVVMTDDGLAKLGIRSDADLPAGGTLERDGERLTGAISGGQAAIIALFDRLPKPTFAEQVQGTQRIFPRAQSARAHGRRRSRRQQSVPARLSGAVRRLAARRAHGARRLQLERPDGGCGARRAHEPHGAAADGLRRRPAAFQRPRRAHHATR